MRWCSTDSLEFYKEEAERLTPEKKAYVAEGVAKILTSQYKIYLSYPAEAVHKNQIVAWDKRIKKRISGDLSQCDKPCRENAAA